MFIERWSGCAFKSLRVIPNGLLLRRVTFNLVGKVEVNQSLERGYLLFQRMLEVRKDKGRLEELFMGYFNKIFQGQPGFQDSITEQDVSSLKLITDAPALVQFREMYGNNYVRPILALDLADYKKVTQKLRGEMSSNGMVISGNLVNEDLITRGLSVIITGSGLVDADKHELKHTLDAQRTGGSRVGQDQVIEEFAAFWGDVVIPRRLEQKTTHRDADGKVTKVEITEREIVGNIQNIRGKLMSDSYEIQYQKQFNSKEEYHSYVDQVTGVIQKLEEKFDKFQIDRILMNAKSLREMKSIIEEK